MANKSFVKKCVPVFTMLIGIPGSGKSTYAEKNYKNYTIISSDAIRKELFGDENVQDKNDLVFHTMEVRTLEALNNNENVIYDATNINRKNRKNIISKLPPLVYKIANIIWAPYEVCIARNEARERTVPTEAIKRMLRNFQMPYWDEGFDQIDITNTYEQLNASEDYKTLLKSLAIPHDNKHHKLNILNHIKKASEYIKNNFGYYDDSQLYFKSNDYENIYYAAMFHDIGKYPTKSFVNSKGEITEEAHYYGHQGYSAWMACEYIDLMFNPIETLWLINNHMEPFFESKYYKNLPKKLKNNLDVLHEADLKAH